jgi:c-di-GMP-binding flagellar brake protein YcgR
MFERTYSLYRRLLGKEPHAADGGTAVQDERRLWVRYEADLQTNVQLAHADRAERVAAQVRDVSIGGARLVVNRRFHLGQMLSLELPGDGETQTVLACVVRVIKLAEERWSLGCTFARELSPTDLERFGARLKPPPEQDQRSWVRHPCTLTANYQCVGEEPAAPATAQVLNISASGVGLLLKEALETGSLINLNLHNSQGALVRTILACVVHRTLRANGEVVAGCNFIRALRDAELRALL